MRLEYLEYFEAAARARSISGAALVLGRNRSTISMAISALEDELGVDLFVRRGNSLSLSPVGEHILDDCARIVALSKGIAERCARGAETGSRELRIGRDDVLPEDFWRHVIREIRRARPELRLSMRYAESDVLPELVREGQLDIAYFVASGRSGPAAGLYSRVVTRIGMKMMVAGNHPLHSMSYVADEDLAALPQITYLDSTQRERFHLDAMGSERIALSSFELGKDAICDGLGWGYVPEPLLSEEDYAQLGQINHGLGEVWYPYFVCSREPLAGSANAAGPLPLEAHGIILTRMREAGIVSE
ncbi:LysR family transcriptional regulator [Nitratireductor indicus]|uniref:LysR family transcriptional regulator n=1 Tax=Nitratireductor indicus TaxID=721133 RepID=UPI00287626FF|nr:LysR family transcriptional regulator [Nitratireductor indicus]MDS1134655.1 LysR family transcriptional regulator [Nitratireductor indicus]